MNKSRDGHFVTPAERKALGTDNVPEFFMHFAIAGHELNHAWIDEILDRAHDENGNNALACTFLREKMKAEDRTDLSKWRWTIVPELQKTLIRYGCKTKEADNGKAE